MTVFFRYASVVVFLFGFVVSAQAETISLETIDRGCYSDDGYHNPASQSYIAGVFNDGSEEEPDLIEYRDFFVFDLKDVTKDSIVSAKLELNILELPEDESFTYQLFHVLADVSTLTQGSPPNHQNIYNDLGEGTKYGIAELLDPVVYSTIQISLTQTFISMANAAAGGQIAIGGTLLAMPAAREHYAFYYPYGGIPPYATKLIIETVPEPGTFLLVLASGPFAFTFIRGQKRKSFLF